MRVFGALILCLVLSSCGNTSEGNGPVHDEQARNETLKASRAAAEQAYLQFRNRSDRIYGETLPDAELGDRLSEVRDLRSGLSFSYMSDKGNGPGSFVLSSGKGVSVFHGVMGDVRLLESAKYREEPIYVLTNVSTSEDGRRKAHVPTAGERRIVADFFQTLHHLWRLRDIAFDRAHGSTEHADVLERLPKRKVSVLFES